MINGNTVWKFVNKKIELIFQILGVVVIVVYYSFYMFLKSFFYE